MKQETNPFKEFDKAFVKSMKILDAVQIHVKTRTLKTKKSDCWNTFNLGMKIRN